LLVGLPEAVQAQVDKSAQRLVVQRKRKRERAEPIAINGMNFVLPENYMNYTFGQNKPEKFLLADDLDAEGNR